MSCVVLAWRVCVVCCVLRHETRFRRVSRFLEFVEIEWAAALGGMDLNMDPSVGLMGGLEGILPSVSVVLGPEG